MAKLRPETHEQVRDETTASAALILPLIARTHGEPNGVLDVGCGPERLWLREAHRIWSASTMLGLDLDEATDAFPMALAWDAEKLEPLPLRAGPHPTETREDGSPATGYSRWPMVLRTCWPLASWEWMRANSTWRDEPLRRRRATLSLCSGAS